MEKPSLELRDAEYRLMVARRRGAHYDPHSPEWEAAMDVARECEQLLRRLDDRATDHGWLGIASAAGT